MSAPSSGAGASQEKRIAAVGFAVMMAITIAFVVTLARVAQLQITPSEQLAAHIDDRVASRREMGARGDLLDRRGRLLAGTRVGRRVFVDPTRFPAPFDQSVLALSEAIGVDADIVGTRVLSRIAENEQRAAEGRELIRYVSLGGVLEPWQVDNVKTLKMAGVHLENRSVREAPAGAATAAIVGKVGVDHDGLLGAEHAFDARLQPEDGRLRYIHDARGRALWIEAGGYLASKPGDTMRLSVDLVLQQIAIDELQRGIEEADAAGGRTVIFDPTTGEVLAMVDLVRDMPGLAPFPKDMPRRLEGDAARMRYQTIRPDPGRDIHPAMARNRCVEDAYEPGSTFKPFLWATITELGLAQADDVVDTEGGRWRTAYGRLLEDVVDKDEQTWAEVLVNSSNIGMVKMVERLSPSQAHGTIRRFGFGARTGIDLPGESAGIVTTLKNWNKYTHTSVSMGYEVAVTPIQMVRAFSAFARAGDLAGTLPPIHITAVPPALTKPAIMHRVLPVWAANLARQTMRGVTDVMDGRMLRAGRIEQPKYDMFGKSGTSKIARPDGKGYFDRQYVCSFIAGAPVDRPRIVVLVVIDDPGPERVRTRTHYGSHTAGPVARRMVERSLAYLGVAPTIMPPVEKQETVATAN